jgi:hypothetical protein
MVWRSPVVVLDIVDNTPVVDPPSFESSQQSFSFDKWVFEQNPTWTRFIRALSDKEFPRGFPEPTPQQRYYAVIGKMHDRQRYAVIMTRPAGATTWDDFAFVGYFIDTDAKYAIDSAGGLVW